ncbi:MAG TPA: proton-conducting transporter membrane subunit, partial [Thermomicrobiales bacterium]|nr:proton-conducting transporter membrane subunit [Thermomicrobiales bacterium]
MATDAATVAASAMISSQGLAAGSAEGVQAMLIYLAVYIFMSAGAFGCVLLMKRDGESVEDIKSLSGLSQT